jgi:hypothetical protein
MTKHTAPALRGMSRCVIRAFSSSRLVYNVLVDRYRSVEIDPAASCYAAFFSRMTSYTVDLQHRKSHYDNRWVIDDAAFFDIN